MLFAQYWISWFKTNLQMVKVSKKVLIANKESIICGWDLINKIAKKNKTKIIPVDSEHFSILEIIKDHNINEIKKVFLQPYDLFLILI